MGLFSLFSKNPEKTEQKGDSYITNHDYGSAKMEYEQTLDILEKKNPGNIEAIKRVQGKCTEAKEALSHMHLKNGDELLCADMEDDAISLFRLAQELTENDDMKARLKKRLEKLKKQTSQKDLLREPEITEENEFIEGSLSEEFYVLCGTMPDNVADAYSSYGHDFLKGYVLLSRGQFPESAELLENALEKRSDKDSYIRFELANAYYNMDKLDDAESLLNVFLEYHTESIQGIDLLCEILCMEQKYDEANKLISSVPDSVKHHPIMILNQGKLYIAEKNYQLAIDLFTPYLKITWDDTIARALAESYEAAGKLAEARSIYSKNISHCSSCGQRAPIQDRLKLADLSFKLEDHSDSTLNLFLDLAMEAPEIKAFCYERISHIYKVKGNDSEAERYRES